MYLINLTFTILSIEVFSTAKRLYCMHAAKHRTLHAVATAIEYVSGTVYIRNIYQDSKLLASQYVFSSLFAFFLAGLGQEPSVLYMQLCLMSHNLV